MKNELDSAKKSVERTAEGGRINPERYGMVFCSNCNGSGRYFYANTGVSVCRVCEGFGLTKAERTNTHDAYGIILSV